MLIDVIRSWDHLPRHPWLLDLVEEATSIRHRRWMALFELFPLGLSIRAMRNIAANTLTNLMRDSEVPPLNPKMEHPP